MSEMNKEKETIPFYPDHISTEFWVTVWIIVGAIIVGILGLISPIGLGTPADSMVTPDHTQPEWYFLFLFQILKYVSKRIGALIPFVALAILILWPFLDRKMDTQRARRVRIILAVGILVAIIILSLLGAYT